MKTKKILVFLALGTLFACQQNEQQETANEALQLSISIENDELGALTRSFGMNYALGKNAFSAGEVLSVAAANEDFQPYTVKRQLLVERYKNKESASGAFCPLPCCRL